MNNENFINKQIADMSCFKEFKTVYETYICKIENVKYTIIAYDDEKNSVKRILILYPTGLYKSISYNLLSTESFFSYLKRILENDTYILNILKK